MRAVVLALLLAFAAPAQEAARCEVEKFSAHELKTLELLTTVVAFGMMCEGAEFDGIYEQGCGELVKPMQLKHRDPRKEPGYSFSFERSGPALRVALEPRKTDAKAKAAPGFLAVDDLIYCNPAGAAEEKEEHLLGSAPDVDEMLEAAKRKQKKPAAN